MTTATGRIQMDVPPYEAVMVQEVKKAIEEAVEARLDDDLTAQDLRDDVLLEIHETFGLSFSECRDLGLDQLVDSLAWNMRQEQHAEIPPFPKVA